MSFEQATRLRRFRLDTMTKGGTNPLTQTLPKTGILAGIGVSIKGAVSGTLSAQNAQGFSSIVKQIRVSANSLNDVINLTGPQYHHLVREHVGEDRDPVPFSNGRTAITAANYDISMFIPVARNLRDMDGLIPLQHERFTAQLSVEFEADANVATGATVTGTVIPSLYVFDTPKDPKDWPDFSRIHMLTNERVVVSGAGNVKYPLPTGDTFLQMLLGVGQAAAGADSWSLVQVKAGQTDIIDEFVPTTLDIDYGQIKGVSRRVGVVPLDWMGTNGFGSYGSARDALHMEDLTDVAVHVTATGALTMEVVKRTLAALK